MNTEQGFMILEVFINGFSIKSEMTQNVCHPLEKGIPESYDDPYQMRNNSENEYVARLSSRE